MIKISKVLEATSQFVKVLRFGFSDVNTPEAIFPYGIDSKPIKNKRGAVSDTSKRGKNIILGYFLKSEKTEAGEIRTYSTDSDGVEKFYIYHKKDGTCEVGGSVDNMVRYSKLNIELQKQVTDINAELVKIAAGIAAAGGSYTVVPITLDLSTAKINEIKTL